eukprot:jgi/Bigna1/135083/aug1.28_g9791
MVLILRVLYGSRKYIRISNHGIGVSIFAFQANDPGGRRTLPAPRADFLVPDNLDYHNVATLGPSPRQVVDATMKAVLELESNPTNEYFGGNGVVEPATLRMEAVREKAAKALGAFLNETLVMPSTTVSLNNVAEGLVSSGFVKRGDFVLTTDQEHAGGLRCWQHYTKVEPLLGGLDVVSIPVSPPPSSEDDVLQLFREALEKKQYRVVTVSHVTTTNGLRLPLRELADLVHQHGAVLVVDGAQAHGGIRVDVHELGVDVYTTSSHKWLCAPKGAGLLFISQRVRDRITPTFLDGGSYPYTGSTGTRPQHTLAGLGAAIDYFESFGFEEVEAYNLRLRSVAYAGFSALAKEIPGGDWL